MNTGRLVDLIGLVDLGLVNWGNSWGIDWRLAREVRRRGELVHLLFAQFLAATCMAYIQFTTELRTNDRNETQKVERVQTKLNNSEGGAGDKGVAYGPSEPCN